MKESNQGLERGLEPVTISNTPEGVLLVADYPWSQHAKFSYVWPLVVLFSFLVASFWFPNPTAEHLSKVTVAGTCFEMAKDIKNITPRIAYVWAALKIDSPEPTVLQGSLNVSIDNRTYTTEKRIDRRVRANDTIVLFASDYLMFRGVSLSGRFVSGNNVSWSNAGFVVRWEPGESVQLWAVVRVMLFFAMVPTLWDVIRDLVRIQLYFPAKMVVGACLLSDPLYILVLFYPAVWDNAFLQFAHNLGLALICGAIIGELLDFGASKSFLASLFGWAVCLAIFLGSSWTMSWDRTVVLPRGGWVPSTDRVDEDVLWLVLAAVFLFASLYAASCVTENEKPRLRFLLGALFCFTVAELSVSIIALVRGIGGQLVPVFRLALPPVFALCLSAAYRPLDEHEGGVPYQAAPG